MRTLTQPGAFHGHAPAVQLSQALHQRQPQSCPFVFTRQAAVDLDERLKELGLLLRGNANARISNRKMHLLAGWVAGNCQSDLAAIGGELDGIAE